MPKYDKCKKCGADAVHLAMSSGVEFFGDQDDINGDQSKYEDVQVEEADVSIGMHVCFNCWEIEDIWIEEPRGIPGNTCYLSDMDDGEPCWGMVVAEKSAELGIFIYVCEGHHRRVWGGEYLPEFEQAK